MAKGFNRPAAPRSQGNNMMQQFQRLQEQMEAIQAQLDEEIVSATTGGSAVKVTMSGRQVCKAITIDPELLKDADAEMLQDLLLTAINLALEESRKLEAERMGPLAGGLGGLGGRF